jgi:hypothetical protein
MLILMMSHSLQASEVGNAFGVPLGVRSADLQFQDKLYQGQQGSVTSGRWRERGVAIKKARIGTSADMERFRTEIRLLLLAGMHGNVVPLLAARALPPGALRCLKGGGRRDWQRSLYSLNYGACDRGGEAEKMMWFKKDTFLFRQTCNTHDTIILPIYPGMHGPGIRFLCVRPICEGQQMHLMCHTYSKLTYLVML